MPQIVVWFVLCLMVFFELKPYFFFFFRKSFWNMDLGCQVEISTLGSYTSCTKSLSRYLESVWNLGPFWYFYFNFSARVIYLYYTSQDHRHQGYFDVSIQIISFSTITISISDFDFDIQISAWSSSDSIISHARIGNVFPIFNTCWYLCCHFLLFFDHSSADDLTIFFVYNSHSLTFWAFTLCLHYTKNCLLFFAHYTSAIAGGTIFCFACRICYISIILDILRCAMICFFEWYGDRYLQILSFVWPWSVRSSLTKSSTTHKSAKQIAQVDASDIYIDSWEIKSSESSCLSSSKSSKSSSSFAKCIILRFFGIIRKYLICFVDFLELFSITSFVWMVFHSKFAKCGFYFGFTCRFTNSQNIIIIFLGIEVHWNKIQIWRINETIR